MYSSENPHEYVDQYNIVGLWLRITSLVDEAKQGFLCGICEEIY